MQVIPVIYFPVENVEWKECIIKDFTAVSPLQKSLAVE